jgi:5S rRNA maturation endonuclease (ribonuclease M5)
MDFNRKALSHLLVTAERYNKGLTEEVISYLAGRGISRAVADSFLLGVCDDIYSGWLSIPYLRPDGVIWINYRNLTGSGSKYKASGKKHLFNTEALDQADASGEVAICEGEIDAITATALCGVPCVGVPGATQWSGNPHWRELFSGYQRVWMLADPDEAGLSLAAAIMEDIPAARLVKLPGDVNETFLSHGGIREFIR